MDLYLEKIDLLNKKWQLLQHELEQAQIREDNTQKAIDDNNDKIDSYEDIFQEEALGYGYPILFYLVLIAIVIASILFGSTFQHLTHAIAATIFMGAPSLFLAFSIAQKIYEPRFEALDQRLETIEKQVDELEEQNKLLHLKARFYALEIKKLNAQINEVSKLVEELLNKRNLLLNQVLEESQKELLNQYMVDDYQKNYEKQLKLILEPNNGSNQ